MNQFHVYASTPDGHAANIMEWRVSVTNPTLAPTPISAPTLAISADHAVGQVELPAAGTWRFSVTVRSKDAEEDVAYADIGIA